MLLQKYTLSHIQSQLRTYYATTKVKVGEYTSKVVELAKTYHARAKKYLAPAKPVPEPIVEVPVDPRQHWSCVLSTDGRFHLMLHEIPPEDRMVIGPATPLPEWRLRRLEWKNRRNA